ncbi:hypothetical protein ACWD27_45415, partial [Streptomyces sp. NPDC002758]
VAFTASPEQVATLALYRRGESDLVCRDGVWFLLATCEVPEAPLNTEPVDFLGIDLGIVNIATTSDGEILAGRGLNRSRVRERQLRTKLQKKNTPSAKRRLKARAPCHVQAPGPAFVLRAGADPSRGLPSLPLHAGARIPPPRSGRRLTLVSAC